MYFIEDRSDPRVSELLTYQIQVIEKHLRHLEKRKEELFRELMVNMFLMGNI